MKSLSTLKHTVCLYTLFSLISFVSNAQSPTAPAQGFNIFTQQGASFSSGNAEGPVAIGTDLTIKGDYSVSNNYTGNFLVDNVKVTLVVNGKVNYTSGNGLTVNQNGYVKIGDVGTSKTWYKDQNNNYSPIRITPTSDYNGSPRISLQANSQQLGVSATNNPVNQGGLIDFTNAFSKMQTASTALVNCVDNANLTNPNGTTISHTNLPNHVKINLNTGINVLNVKAADLANLQILTFNNQPDANHVFLINIDAQGTFNWNVWNSGGIGNQSTTYVLYNFYNTTTLNINGNGAVMGTVFAPYADIIKSNNQSQINGQVIGKSFTQTSGSVGYYVFTTDLSACTVACTAPYTWTGNVSTDWNTAGNWCAGKVPDVNADAIIPSTVRNCIISNNAAYAKTITIATGGVLKMTGSADLNITGSGTITNNGTFNGSAATGAVIFNGTGTVAGTMVFQNVTLNGSVNFGTASTVNGNLTLNNNSILNTNSVTYTSSSSLIYNLSQTTITAGYEWYKAAMNAGWGIPQNVTVQNNSNISLAASVALPGNLNISSGGSVNLNGNTLSLGGAFTGTGKLKGSNTSGLIIYGIAGTVYFDRNYKELNILTINTNASLTLGDSLNINAGSAFGTLTVNGKFNTNNVIVLKSDAKGTAVVGPSAGAVSGTVTVERYIPARRAWRFIGVPFISSTQTINQAWQEGASNKDLIKNENPNPGYGTQITYDNSADHGYDFNTTVNPSMKRWSQSTSSWSTAVPYTNSTNLVDGSGNSAYCLFIRGSRAVQLSQATSAVPDPTILRATGVIAVGNTLKKLYTANAGEQIFIANPYASPIYLKKVFQNATGIVTNKYYVWDPTLGGTYGVGGYVTFSAGVKAPQNAPGYLNVADTSTLIQSGQAFFVQVSGSNATGSATINFNESDKSVKQSNVFGFTGGSQQTSSDNFKTVKLEKPDPRVYINLTSAIDQSVIIDGVAAVFNKAYSTGIDDYDASKKFNFNESIALRREGKSLAIEARPIPGGWDTLFLRQWYLKTQDYNLQIRPEYMTEGTVEAWLVDNYLKTQTQLTVASTRNYTFSANSDTNSYASRFMIVFKVQKKVVKQTDMLIAQAKMSSNAAGKILLVSPNPAKVSENIMMRFENVAAGDYEVKLFSPSGSLLRKGEINHTKGSAVYPFMLPATLTQGVYNVSINNTKTYQVYNLRVIVQQ